MRTPPEARLRAELCAKLRTHPPALWSGPLLQIVLSAIDLQFPPPRVVDKPRRHRLDVDDPDPPRAVWLRRYQVAERLGVRRQTLDRWAAERKGPDFSKFGKYAWYRLSDVEAWQRSESRAVNCAP